jgi:voltage-gated potassium channel
MRSARSVFGVIDLISALAVMLILLVCSLIIVLTGFVAAEMVARATRREFQRECPRCFAGNHQEDARHCRRCQAELPPTK